MKRVVVGICALLFVVSVARAWVGGGEDEWALVITSVSQYPSTTNIPPYDVSVATNWIDYDNVADVGSPVTLETWIRVPAGVDTWSVVQWEYIAGSNSLTSTNWTLITAVTNNWSEHEGRRCRQDRFAWTPPDATNYLIRVYGRTEQGAANSSRLDTDITSKGGSTWHDAEVIGLKIGGNKRPGF